jgi:hypothetical protein
MFTSNIYPIKNEFISDFNPAKEACGRAPVCVLTKSCKDRKASYNACVSDWRELQVEATEKIVDGEGDNGSGSSAGSSAGAFAFIAIGIVLIGVAVVLFIKKIK